MPDVKVTICPECAGPVSYDRCTLCGWTKPAPPPRRPSGEVVTPAPDEYWVKRAVVKWGSALGQRSIADCLLDEFNREAGAGPDHPEFRQLEELLGNMTKEKHRLANQWTHYGYRKR